MRIKYLAQGENILMLGIEPSTFVSKIDILTTTPIVQKILFRIFIAYSKILKHIFLSLNLVFNSHLYLATDSTMAVFNVGEEGGVRVSKQANDT